MPKSGWGAVMSPCGKYRYKLTRSLGSPLRWYRPIVFVMLNPSTADAEADDPTIRRCMAFAKREGGTHLTVVNLFAYRATDPDEVKRIARENIAEAVGPDNDSHLERELTHKLHLPVVAAWGSATFARLRATTVTEKYGPFQCLGISKGGQPKHPLYISGDQPLVPYMEAAAN